MPDLNSQVDALNSTHKNKCQHIAA